MNQLAWLPSPARALVIGINHYEAAGIRDLRGCVPDALAVAAFLRERVGMDEAQILLLTSPAQPGGWRATREAIIRGFREFLGAAPSGSEVLCYFSGHGSTSHVAPEIAFGEPVAESFVPADARVGEVYDLLDREMSLLVDELRAKGIRLTMIADSCHAGGALRVADRSGDPTAPVPRLTGISRTIRDASTLLRQEGEDDVALLRRLGHLHSHSLQNYTFLAAAQGTQQSYELPPALAGSTEWRGAMTLALLDALERANAPLSYRELARTVRARIPAHPQREHQYPSLSGAPDRFLFTTQEVARRKPTFAVQEVMPDAVLVDGGSLDGIRVGSTLTLFSDWSLREAIGVLEPSEVRSTSAIAPLPAGLKGIEPGMPVELAAPRGRTIRFHPGTGEVEELWRRIVENRSTEGGGSLLALSTGMADYHLRLEEETWVVRRADGSEVAGLRHPRSAIAALAHSLDRAACFDAWQAWSPPVVERLDLTLYQGTCEGPGLCFRAARRVAGVEQPVRSIQGESGVLSLPHGVIVLSIENRSGQVLYLHLYRLEPAAFYIERLWPLDGPGELRHGGTARAEYRHRQEGTLNLKLIVSGMPLEGPVYPCGGERTFRSSRDLFPVPELERGTRSTAFRITVGNGP